MIDSLVKTLNQTSKSYFWKIIFISGFITLLSIITFIWGSSELIEYLVFNIEFIKSWQEYFSWVSYLGGFLATIISYFLLPILFPLISYIFQDYVISNLEKQHSEIVIKSDISLINSIFMGLKFGIYSLFLNIIFLPFYFIPMIGFIIYFALNSYLLGREYYDISAISFIKKDNFKQHKKKISGKLNLMGLVISIGFITPLLNLIMPILAVIFSWLYIKNTQK